MSKQATSTEPTESLQSRQFRWLLASIVLLQAAGLFLPRHLFWGISFWQELGRTTAVVVLAIALLLVVSPMGNGLARLLAAIGSGFKRLFGKLPRAIPVVLGLLLALALFFWFRSRALVYGDGYMVVDSFTLLEVKPQLATYFMKPLVLFWHRLWFAALSSLTLLSPTEIVSLVTAAGGVVGTSAIWRISGLLGQTNRGRYLIFAGACTSAAVILFFGYVENYTWATALGLWSLAFSLRYLKEGKSRRAAVVFGVIATGFHLFASPFLVLALVATLAIPRAERLTVLGLGLKQASVALIALSLLAALFVQLTEAVDFTLGIWPAADAPYAAFSPRHLLDVENELLLVAPLGFVALLMLLGRRKTGEAPPIAEQALGLLSLLTFLLSFWINPSLGAARDWDLLSFFGIPFSLWGVTSLTRHYLKSKAEPVHVLAVALVALACLLPNLYEKNNLPVATARLDTILWEDPHYQKDYQDAARCLPWSYTLFSNVHDSERAEKYNHRRIAASPNGPTAWFNLGSLHMRRNTLDSAAFYLSRAVVLDSTNLNSLALLIRAQATSATLAQLEEYAARAARLFTGNMGLMTELGIAYQRHGLNAEALDYFRRAESSLEAGCNEAVNLALMLAYLNQHDSACFYVSRALSGPCDNKIELTALRQLFSSSLKLGRFADARQALERLSRLIPNSDEIPMLRGKLEEAEARRSSD